MSKTLMVDSYQMRLANIGDIEVQQLHALSMSVGWPHRAEDWRDLLKVGDGLVAIDEIDRVSASVMWFTHGRDFATVAMLITSPRLQSNGASRWLAAETLKALDGRKIRINATRAAKALCASFGFEEKSIVYQCQGVVRAQSIAVPDGRTLRPLTLDDLPAISALDAQGFTFERAAHLKNLIPQSTVFGLFSGARLCAYSMCRAFGRGHVIGPVVAESQDDAMAVIAPHIEAHNGTFLRLDTHFASGPFAQYLQDCQMSIFDTVTTMTLKDKADYGDGHEGAARTFALASQSLG